MGGAYAPFTGSASDGPNQFTTDTLDPPTGLTAACGATITLDWTATTDTYATGYRVFRSEAPGGLYTQIAEIASRATVTYDDTPASGVYYYLIRAYHLDWESDATSEVVGATGTCYYVRTDGSDTNTGLLNSPGGAWQTIQKAASTMIAGNTVVVQPGTYPETVSPTNSGTAVDPIVYLAHGSVVVDGGNTRCKAFDIVGTDHVVVDGFEVTDQPDCGGADSAIDVNNSDNVTIRNNVIHDTGRDAIYFKGTSTNGLVENNLIYNIDDDGSTPIGGGGHTFRNNTFAGSIAGWTIENGLASNLFENNIFWASAIQRTDLGTFNHNDYNGGALPGTANFSSDPLFANAVGYDFRLSQIAAGQGSDSPALDAGSDTAANLDLDNRSTRTDSTPDTGTVDVGYHYPL